MKTPGKDHSVSVRVSPELLSKLQARVAEVAEFRAKHPNVDASDAERRRAYAATISGMIRKAVETYFAISDDPRAFVLSNFSDVIADEIRAVLATAVHDAKARDLLKRLAEPSESDFG